MPMYAKFGDPLYHLFQQSVEMQPEFHQRFYRHKDNWAWFSARQYVNLAVCCKTKNTKNVKKEKAFFGDKNNNKGICARKKL